MGILFHKKPNNMIYLIVAAILCGVWIGYELFRAPYMDENGNIIDKKKKDERNNL